MAADSYDGQIDFAQGIIENTLDTIRDQEEAKQNLALRGVADFSTSVFKAPELLDFSQSDEYYRRDLPRRFWQQSGEWVKGRHWIWGTVNFVAGFRGLPQVTFGQEAVRTDVANQTQVGLDYMPFLVQPYVYSWSTTNDLVGGFVLGLYALTVPPEIPQRHRIFWQASGTASRYRDVEADEAWSEEYDHNDAVYLEDDADVDYDSNEAPEFAEGETDYEDYSDE